MLHEIESNPEIKAVLITWCRGQSVCAGADISEFTALNSEQGMAMARRGQTIFFKIENCTKPIIAAVNGFALGGGCELAMAVISA